MITATTPDELGTKADVGVGTPRILVPTMGFLHEGHLSLVDRARRHDGQVVMSIFVNPLQFGEGEDLDTYPRDVERDTALAEERGVDVLFIPSLDTMYPGGDPGVTIDPGPAAGRLCGAYRPGHFRGVLTVVAKLFNLVKPDTAVFGRKDYQQAVLIQRMVDDLNMGVEIDMAPIVREPDGLALSSRNVRLTADQRRDALGLSRALRRASELFDEGERDPAALTAVIRAVTSEHPGLSLEYAELVSGPDLERPERVGPGDVIAVAGYCGKVRLIDNLLLEPRTEQVA